MPSLSAFVARAKDYLREPVDSPAPRPTTQRSYLFWDQGDKEFVFFIIDSVVDPATCQLYVGPDKHPLRRIKVAKVTCNDDGSMHVSTVSDDDFILRPGPRVIASRAGRRMQHRPWEDFIEMSKDGDTATPRF